MTDKEKIRAFVEGRRKENWEKRYNNSGGDLFWDRANEDDEILFFIDSLQEESIGKVWHYQKEEPINEITDKSRPIVVICGYNSLNTVNKFRCYEDNSEAIWLSNHYEKWAFIEDLINLSQSVKTSIQEEPVSEDLEEASRNYADNEEYGDDMYFAIKAAFETGTKWQKEQDAKILESIITNGKDYPTLDSFLNTFKMMQYGKIKM